MADSSQRFDRGHVGAVGEDRARADERTNGISTRGLNILHPGQQYARVQNTGECLALSECKFSLFALRRRLTVKTYFSR